MQALEAPEKDAAGLRAQLLDEEGVVDAVGLAVADGQDDLPAEKAVGAVVEEAIDSACFL